jgi:hypothetical protein
VVKAKAATAASQKLKKSTTPLAITSEIDLIEDEDEEEPYDSDLDELGW